MKSMATSSSSSSKTSLSPHHPPHFTPIEEGNEEEEFSQGRMSFRATPASDYTEKRDSDYTHFPTPLNSEKSRRSSKTAKKRQEKEEASGVSCNKCRPSNRERFSVVPLESNNGGRLSMASPNGIFKSILASLALKRSPKSSGSAASSSSREEHWKIVVAELSNKLIQASRRRDEAVLEASKLKYSMAELEKKLNKLEIYCHNLKSELETCTTSHQKQQHKSPSRIMNYQLIKVGDQSKVIEHFLVSVSETRSSVRFLARALGLQLRQMGPKVYDRIAMLLQPYDIKISISRNPRALVFYLEALLNLAFFEDFESAGFHKSGPSPILNPIDRCESNFAMFSRLQELTWEEVLNKGTRHFSEDFSKFCDRKMSDIVALLGWNRAWPEPLLQAFFGASKTVWLVHLLANSLHPGLPIFRVDKGVGFDPVYMEDMGGDKAKKLIPTMVRIMVTPGFYVFDNVVKCKVLCRYYNNNNNDNKISVSHIYDTGCTPSPS
ncbi:IRK-interacting protein [Salvia miltiorrhiza]|uniref:IRK-interacting protein n=1 Tax=Salvia miltiorrhiza TaxID=226208 RepID=UPI0025AC633F|nr:IRK-interacting protein [Salvia miltiorrhiza]